MAITDAAVGGLAKILSRARRDLPREIPAATPQSPNGDTIYGTPRVLDRLSPGMAGRLPKGMAELAVYRTEDGEHFALIGAYGDRLASKLGSYGKPELDLNLNALAIQLDQTINILADMADWSREQRQLVAWLNRSRTDADRDCAELELVIWDDTAFRIPWELFWLTDPGHSPPGFLGTLLTITRWLEVGDSPFVQDFTMNPAPASGGVAAYIHEDMADDRTLFDGLEVEYSKDRMWGLLEGLLDERLPALAMVYAGCHGEFDGEFPRNARIGEVPLSRANFLADQGFGRLQYRRTLVFLNACASGPLGTDGKKLNDGAVRGFPKMFLAAGAAGVLATAAPIGNAFALGAADALIGRLKADPELSIAKAIRDLRREAARGLAVDVWQPGIIPWRKKANNARLLPILYWSLYLYYGSPRMAISFAAAGDPPATG
jgi:hypothetical protein